MERNLINTLMSEMRDKIHGGIYNKLQIDFAYNSNHIEGSRLTHEQTRYIFETHTVGGNADVNDVFETANHFACFDHILKTLNEPLSENFIKDIHGKLKSGVLDDNDAAVAGDYKKYPNIVGGIETVSPENVSAEMNDLLEKFAGIRSPDIFDIADFHARFEKIHPFYDGNGRIGRLIIFKQCLENDIVPFFISDANKMFYYMGLREWQSENKYMRLLDVFLSAQDEMKNNLGYFRIEYDRSEINAAEILRKHNIAF